MYQQCRLNLHNAYYKSFDDLCLIAVISTWGGDHTSADILVKHDAIANVTRVFKRENIAYEIIIEDLQKRIDEENPPRSPEELELDDRRGMTFYISLICHVIFNGIIRIYIIHFFLNIPILTTGLPMTDQLARWLTSLLLSLASTCTLTKYEGSISFCCSKSLQFLALQGFQSPNRFSRRLHGLQYSQHAHGILARS